MFLEVTGKARKETGWIEVICGSMFSGKTEELIRRLKRAEFAKQKIKIFKPAVDKQFHEKQVVSHDAKSIDSIPLNNSSEILNYISDVEVVGIDEAQFFDMFLPDICNKLANRGIRVIVAGLDMDYQGKPFGPIPNLLAIAEYITKVHAICMRTGKLANYSHRINNSSDLVQLGEKADYEPLSREAFVQALKEENNRNSTTQDEC